MPWPAYSYGARPVRSCSSKKMRPAEGLYTPLSKFRSVVLPAPFGPMIEYTAPDWISKLRSSTAFKPPNFFARPSTRSRLMPPPPLRCRGSSAATVGGRSQSRPVASLQGRGAADEAEQGPHLQDGDATRIRTHGAAGRLRPPPGSDPRLAPGPLFRPSAAPAPCSCPLLLVSGGSLVPARRQQPRQAGHHPARQENHGADHHRAEHHHFIILE